MCKLTLVHDAQSGHREVWMWRRQEKDQLACARARTRPREAALALLLCSALSGCALLGGQTGQDDSGPGECTDSERQLAWDEVSPFLRFAAAEARAVVVGQHVASFRWDDANPAYSFEPEHGESQIVIDVAPPTALPKLITKNGCYFYLSFESDVTVTTAGGALLEQFQGGFEARDHSLVDLRAMLPLDQITGSLSISPKDGALPTLLRVQGVFSDRKTSGSVSASFSAADFGPSLGCWPNDDSCGSLL